MGAMEASDLCPAETLAEYARMLKAVGHPISLRLLCLIERRADPCVSDMWKCLNQPQPVISQHLAILKQNDIVSAEVQKTRRVYSIVDPFIRDLVRRIIADNRLPDLND
ncbi:MAG: helix-turn-helix transcriptional regulator [Treponema sp.]|nr:helix-turn-helix transcriptional regulator [Treponema sp.]